MAAVDIPVQGAAEELFEVPAQGLLEGVGEQMGVSSSRSAASVAPSPHTGRSPEAIGVLGWPGREQRTTIYTTTATVAALVGSFVTAAIAQYAASTGRRMHELRTNRRLGPQFRRNWVSILSATLTISGLCLLATVLDTTEHDPGGVHWLTEIAIILGAVRSMRLIWLFNKVIEVGDEDLADNRPSLPEAGTPSSAAPSRTRVLPPGT
ncbi:hypothetical protein [Streptomyces iranensis]|nr:hypothetical protein [Streptomyces iranensis]MBP2061605.1 membrane protein YqaA with SNARE-associated domain [Streptomyces iranensis]